MGYWDIQGDDYAGQSGNWDILGDDLLGDDLLSDELLGAVMRRSAARGALMARPARGRGGAAAAAYAQRVAQSKAVVREDKPSGSRRLPLPIDSGVTIAAATTQILTVRPTNPFRPELLVVDPAIAPSFLVNDIKIGRRSQFIGSGSVPAAAFSPLSPLVTLQFDTDQISQDISVSVTNTSGAPQRFTGFLLGTIVDF